MPFSVQMFKRQAVPEKRDHKPYPEVGSHASTRATVHTTSAVIGDASFGHASSRNTSGIPKIHHRYNCSAHLCDHLQHSFFSSILYVSSIIEIFRVILAKLDCSRRPEKLLAGNHTNFSKGKKLLAFPQGTDLQRSAQGGEGAAPSHSPQL